MKPQKSSKKINVIVVVLVLLMGILIGGYLVLHSNFSTATVAEQISKILEQGKEPVTGCKPNPDDKNKDSDNDGLMDWQEVTWKTNPCVPDTDKDGYLDGEEVSSGYSPTIQAPNDALPDRDTSSPRGLPSNLTQALAQSLNDKITNGEMGMITDASELTAINTSNQVINQAMQEIVARSIQEFSLSNIPDKEIIISPDNRQVAIQNYAGEVARTIDTWAEKTAIDQGAVFVSEADIFYYALQTKDFSEVEKNIVFYKNISEEIKKIPVPSDLKEIHKEQIGIFQVMSNIYQAIRGIDIDPLKTNLALEQYEKTVELLNQTLLKLADYIRTHP